VSKIFIFSRLVHITWHYLFVIVSKVANIVISADIRQLAETLSQMMRQRRVRLTKGQSGRFYLIYYDSAKDEPFRAIALPEQCADERVKLV
jgi:hypothetical protein